MEIILSLFENTCKMVYKKIIFIGDIKKRWNIFGTFLIVFFVVHKQYLIMNFYIIIYRILNHNIKFLKKNFKKTLQNIIK